MYDEGNCVDCGQSESQHNIIGCKQATSLDEISRKLEDLSEIGASLDTIATELSNINHNLSQLILVLGKNK